MKILFVGFFSGVLFILSNKHHVTDGQYFYDTNQYFVPFEFDPVERGLWNSSECLRDLLNCWEQTRGEILCSYARYKTSICDFWRDSCDDYNNELIDNPGANTLFERYCKDGLHQLWSKKK